MKIGIITFHFPYNCGAVLQCIALQTKLENLGNEVCVINYRPWYHQNRYTPFKNPIYYGKKCFKKKYVRDPYIKRFARAVIGALRTIHSWVDWKKVKISDEKFETFILKHLNQTKLFRTNRQLKKKYPKCDLFISGSDQLWNAKLTEGVIDPAYLLEFAKNGETKITYAVGVDFSQLTQDKEEIKNSLLKFDAISLRESRSINMINQLCDNKIDLHIDLDPTFLLDAIEYEPFISKVNLEEKPFILVYTMPNKTQHKVNNAARILSKKTGYKIIDINGSPNRINKKIDDNRICGPDEFLWYMKNAKYVITNSFHGTAFSVIFQKQFITIPHTNTGYRVTELLDRLSLSERYQLTGESAAANINHLIDYSVSYTKLQELRNDSIAYLKKYTSDFH